MEEIGQPLGVATVSDRAGNSKKAKSFRQIIPKARNAASHPTSHKQHGATRLATAPDRPTIRVSQSPDAP